MEKRTKDHGTAKFILSSSFLLREDDERCLLFFYRIPQLFLITSKQL
jgi:hypothetical protein